MKRWMKAPSMGLWLLLCLACGGPLSADPGMASGPAPVSPSGEGGRRTVARDSATGGPGEVRADDLAPHYSGEDLEAIRALEAGRSGPVIARFSERASGDEGEASSRAAFLVAYAWYRSDRLEEAQPHLERCVTSSSLFADYCRYWAADTAFRLQRYRDAETWAAVVPEGAVLGPRARHLRGRALLRQERWEAAREALEGFLTEYPQASYRNDVELDLAAACVGEGDVDEAARIHHRLMRLNPGDAVERTARERLDAIRSRVSAPLRRELEQPSAAEKVERANVLFQRHRSQQVIDLLEPMIGGLAKGSTERCQASSLVGRSYSKLREHRKASPHYEDVLAHCLRDTDLMVRTLYAAGRGYWNTDEDDRALASFQRIWRDYPKHTYADDAYTLAARVHRGNGQTAKAQELLRAQRAAYPDGDMLKEAVWLEMSDRYLEGDYRGALKYADEVGRVNGENDLYTRGRLGYFRARSLERLSLGGEAKAGYAQVARDAPMSYYALMSLNRLRALDGPMFERLMGELTTPGEKTEDTIRISPTVRTDENFRRGVELLRIGLQELAHGELRQLQGRYANDEEVGWALSLLYHRTGAYVVSHNVPGKRLDLRLQYPAGSNVQRWEVAYPRPYVELVEKWATERKLSPWFVLAIMREESGFNPKIESWANARGLLQLMLPTANDMAKLSGRKAVTAQELFEPATNIELGTLFMRRLSDRFSGHPFLMAAGYNAGAGNVGRWLTARRHLPVDIWVEEIPFEEARHYVKRVSMTYWVYTWLYGTPGTVVEVPFDLTGIDR